MKATKTAQRGSSLVIILAIAIALGVSGLAAWKIVASQKAASEVAKPQDSGTQSSVARKSYTDTAGHFTLSYPSDWSVSYPEKGGHDNPVQAEPDWTKVSRPLLFTPASGEAENNVIVTPGCETTDSNGAKVSVLDFLKGRKDQFHSQKEITINGYAGFYDKLDFKTDAESYLDHTYFVTNDSDCLLLTYRENWHHDMSNTNFDDSKNVPDFKAIVDSTKFMSSSPISVEGEVGCLEPKDKTGPHITSCAIGIKQDDGTSYALGSDDPTLTGSIPTGQQVRVTGTFTEQTSTYDAKGLIHVTSVEKL
jgi:hypothetical protein